MNSINNIFKECAKAIGLHTYMYARIKEANYRMDDVRQFPVVLRLFNETVSETKIDMMRRRTTSLIFCDALGKAEPDTETEVMPIVEKMEVLAFDFINNLRQHGIEVQLVSSMTPFYSRFDSLVAGVSVTITLTYPIC